MLLPGLLTCVCVHAHAQNERRKVLVLFLLGCALVVDRALFGAIGGGVHPKRRADYVDPIVVSISEPSLFFFDTFPIVVRFEHAMIALDMPPCGFC